MAPHGSRQPDIDLAGLVADDIDGAAGEPLVEQFSEPLVADARVPLAQGVKEFFPRQREDRRSGSGRMSGHGLASLHTSSISRNLERACRHASLLRLRRRHRTRYRVSVAPFIASATSPGNARAGARKANVTRAIMTNVPCLAGSAGVM
jgi:hypothetical protein